MRLPAVPVILASLVAACAESGPPPVAAALPPDVAPGLGVYVARCEGCHGTDADGTPAGPSLLTSRDSAWEARLVRSVREGVPPTEGSPWNVRGMPPVPMVPQDEVRLANYLRWLRAGAPTTP
jgi:cytochrome c5